MSLGSSSESSLEKLEEKVRKSDGGVVYVGHLPHGFYEDQIKKYCSQFGTVLGVKVSRSKKTGRSKGFGFIEFENEEVAKIVADSMNNYLMFDKLLKCEYIEPNRVHGGMLASRKLLKKDIGRSQRLHTAQKSHNAGKSLHQYKRSLKRLLKSERKKKKRLSSLGMDYTFPGYSAQSKNPQHIIFQD